MTDQDNAAMLRKPTKRSPSYPGISLPKAIGRVQALYEKEKQYPTPVDAVVKVWGYSGMSGPASGTLAALKKFGLLDEEGAKADRRVQVTDLAVRILNHPNAQLRHAAVQEAALIPPIHQEMWSQYGTDLPSDGNLTWTLTRERGFTDAGAADFVREYRESIEFAKLESQLTVDQNPSRTEEPSDSQAIPVIVDDDFGTESSFSTLDRHPVVPGRHDMRRSIDVPLPGGASVVVDGLFPLTELQWNQFIAVLTVMKPGLVDEEL